MSFPRNKVAANATSSSKDVSLENKKRKVSGENTISSKKKRTVTGDFGKSDLDLRIETVSAASYVSGCLAFGYVLQVLPHHVLVSLPGGITGIVPETEVSDRLANPIDTHNAGGLDVHDPILCFVIGKSATDKQLRLSTRNSVVNRGINFKNLCVGYFIQGTIESKEDHGYTVNCGMDETTFFLPFKRVSGPNKEIRLGKIVYCKVESKDLEARIASLALNPNEKVKNALFNDPKAITFPLLKPGMLVQACIESVVENGLYVKAFNSFRCVIDVNSLLRYPVKENYHKGDFIVARVVFIDPSTKSIRLCAKGHVVRLKLPTALPALGDFLMNLEVVRIHKKTGIYLRSAIPTTSDEASVAPDVTSNRPNELLTFVHKSKLSSNLEELEDKSLDQPITDERMTSTYRVGDVIRKVRILGYHLVEGIAVATNLQHHIDDDSITHWSHLHIGALQNAVIVSVKDAGLNLKIGDKVNAFCPTQHLSDTTASRTKASASFKVGQKIKVKIWQIKPDGSIIATHKKSLIEEVQDNIFSYDDVVIGKVAIGVISNVSDNGGVTIHFYNGIKGSIPVSILMKQGVSNISEAFRPGQTLKCVTLAKFRAKDMSKSSSQERRGQQDVIILALMLGNAVEILSDLSADVRHLYAGITNLLIKEEDRKESDNVLSTAGYGSFVGGSIFKVEESFFKVALDDGRTGILHKHQCFDFAETGDFLFNNKDLASSIIGAKVENAVVLEDAKGKNVLISVKPLLCQAKGSTPSFPLHLSAVGNDESLPTDVLFLPASPSDVHPGQVVAGFVHKVEEFGVLVKFLNGFIALIPLPNIGDKFVSDASNLFTIGDSVRCVVQRVDLEHDKVILTCKSLLVSPSGGSLCFLEAYLSQVLATKYAKTDFATRVSNLKIGSTIQGVARKQGNATLLVAETDKDLHLVDVNQAKMSQSKKIKCVVLDVDWEKQVIEVSTDVDLVQSVSKQLHDESHVGDSLSVNILLVKDKYLVASVASTGNFVLVMTSDYHKPYSQELEYQPGAILTATIIHTSATSGISLYSNLPITTLSDPIQKSLLPLTVSGEQSGGHLKIGKTLSFKIIDINATEMIVEPVRSDKSFEKTKTIVHVSNIPIRNLQLEELLTTQHHPFKEFSVGQTITCKVLHIRIVSPEENESNDSDLSQLAYLTVVASSENSSSDYLNFIQWKGRHSVKEGQIYPAVVTKTSEVNCVVSLSPYVSTHLQLMDVSTNTTLIKKFKKKVYVGLSLFVCVTKLETKGNSKFSLTVSRACIENHLTEGNTSIPPPIPSNSSIEIGTVLFGILDLEHSTKSSRPPALTVWLGQMLPPGRVCICEVDEYENWQDHSTSIWSQDEVNNDFIIAGRKHGDFVKCVVKDRFGDRIELSLRPSRLLKKATPMIVSTDEIPEVGSLVKGYVTNITPNGCFVRLSSELTAIVYLKDLDDGFIENFVELFPVGKLVQGRLLSCNSAEGTARLSLKQKDVTGTEIVSKEISVLNVGDIVTGVIERLTNFGVFVKLDGSSVVGLSRNDVSVDRNLNKLPEEIYNIGDIVKAKIINISKSLNKVALALASSFLLSKSDSTHEPASDLYEEHELKTTESVPNSAPVVVSRRNASLLVWNDFEDLQSVKKAKTEVHDETNVMVTGKAKATIQISSLGESWQRPDDFEKLLLSCPNSSFAWIQYIAFYLKSLNIEVAREVAERALRTINYREEEEKYNIWVAYLTFEIKFGSRNTVDAVFSRAISESKGKYLHIKMAELIGTSDEESAVEMFDRAVKKYKYSKKVWSAFIGFRLLCGDYGEAKNLLSRSLLSLSRHKHCEVIQRYALGEFEVGSPDRARVIFESLLSSYPQRIDLWHVYIDKEVKLKDFDKVRAIFDRLITLKTTSHNLKNIFKKYLNFEMNFGTAHSQDIVKQKARDYVASILQNN